METIARKFFGTLETDANTLWCPTPDTRRVIPIRLVSEAIEGSLDIACLDNRRVLVKALLHYCQKGGKSMNWRQMWQAAKHNNCCGDSECVEIANLISYMGVLRSMDLWSIFGSRIAELSRSLEI